MFERRLALLPLAAAIALQFPPPASAATIVVNDAGSESVPGKCTLIDAVAALNNAAPQNACAAGDGNADVIDLTTFTAPTTILLDHPTSLDGNAALELDEPVTLRAGVDAQQRPLVTLMRSAQSGVPFRILTAYNNVTLSGVTVSGGSLSARGGGIYALGSANVTLDRAAVTNNSSGVASGGGIAADCGEVILRRSTISGNTSGNNGGGVYLSGNGCGSGAAGYVYLDHSTVRGNTAGYNGGGVYSFSAPITASYSNIDANAAATTTTATHGLVGGGGFHLYGALSLYGSTVSNNTSGKGNGGIYAGSGYFVNSTVSGNQAVKDSGGFFVRYLTLKFSTIAANTPDVGNDIPAYAFRLNSSGSIIAGLFSSNFNGDHNVLFAPSASLVNHTLDTKVCDPLLQPLADNGGLTPTQRPGAGSCARGAGPPAGGIAFDQRGPPFARTVGGKTDAGAVEGALSGDLIFYDGFAPGG